VKHAPRNKTAAEISGGFDLESSLAAHQAMQLIRIA